MPERLGKLPKAFTHVGLINAALSLAKRRKARSRFRIF